MVLEDPEPSFEERWRRRIEAMVAVAATMAFSMVLQFQLLNRNLWTGLGFAPLLHFGTFQLVSRIVTGAGFSVRLRPDARSGEEVRDVIFTVAFLFTLLVGVYSVFDAAAPVPPPPRIQ